MTITSFEYLAFCIAAVVLFLLFPRRFRWISLLISSVAFYVLSVSDKRILVWIVITALSTWLAGRWMDLITKKANASLAQDGLQKEEKKRIKKAAQKRNKAILVAALILNVGILVAFKLLGYFTGAFTMIVGVLTGNAGADVAALVLPLGISYYTFSTIGYMLDIYWKRQESEKNFARYFLFAIYFPRILQGPISRYSSLGQELKKPRLYFKWDNFVVGMERICLGCFKKLVIADRAGIFVGNTLRTAELAGNIYLLAMIFDAIQIYADFSGYMDIVSGISKMFDVELEQNFNHPFLAASVPDFWRRWHMSLGSWFKDYVYYPITVSKGVKKLNKKVKDWKNPQLKNLALVIIPVMVTWLLTGLWHGNGAGYVAWGLYYGGLIALSVTFSEDVQRLIGKLHIHTDCFSYRVFQTVKIFCIFMGGRFLGTAMGLTHRVHILRQIFTPIIDFNIYGFGLTETDFRILIVGVILLIAIGALETKEDLFHWFNRQNKLFCAIVLFLLIFTVFLFGIYGAGYDTSTFMYQQF